MRLVYICLEYIPSPPGKNRRSLRASQVKSRVKVLAVPIQVGPLRCAPRSQSCTALLNPSEPPATVVCQDDIMATGHLAPITPRELRSVAFASMLTNDAEARAYQHHSPSPSPSCREIYP